MKIGIFIFGLTWGGATRRVLTLAKAFEEQGHKVRFIVVEKGGYLEDVADGVLVEELGKGLMRPLFKKLSKKRKMDLSRWPLVACLRKAERHADMDILLSAANHAHIAAISAKLLSGTSIPLVIRLSNHLTSSLKTGKGLKKRVRFIKSCRLYPHADGFVAVSKNIAEDTSRATGIPVEKIRVVYNPTFTPGLLDKAREHVDHPWLSGDKRQVPPVILAAGRLSAQKDFAMLIRAFSHAVRQRDMRLIILGEGKERQALKRLISKLGVEDKVDLHGFVPNPLAFMSKAHLFCLSSRFEGLPGVLIEALAAGCPVVSTDSPGGAGEIIEDGRFGILVPVGDDKAMSEAILKGLDTRWNREELKKRAEYFSVDKAVQGYLKVFEDVLRAKKEKKLRK